MRKIYLSLIATLVIAGGATAAPVAEKTITAKKASVKAERVAGMQRPVSVQGSSIFLSDVTGDREKMSGLHVAGMRKADANTSIEGRWTFNLGDYYFNDSADATIQADFMASIRNGVIYFEDPTGGKLPFAALFDDEASTTDEQILIFPIGNFGLFSQFYLAQEPFVWDAVAEDLITQPIRAKYYPRDGIILFEPENGIAWVAYIDEKYTQMEGYFDIYDLEGAIKDESHETTPSDATSMEGNWEIPLYDHYQVDYSLGEFIGKYTVTVDGANALFVDSFGDDRNIAGTLLADGISFVIGKTQVGPDAANALFQVPYINSLDTDDVNSLELVESLTATYDAKEGTLTFPANSGIAYALCNSETGVISYIQEAYDFNGVGRKVAAEATAASITIGDPVVEAGEGYFTVTLATQLSNFSSEDATFKAVFTDLDTANATPVSVDAEYAAGVVSAILGTDVDGKGELTDGTYSYSVVLQAYDADGKLIATSNVKSFIGEITSGVEAIGAENVAPRYFDLNGIEVNNPLRGSVLIRIEGDKTSKVIVK